MSSPRRLTAVAATLVVAQLIVRSWIVARGDFYWDDLILIGRASSAPILSWDLLGEPHDGHFMPGAFLVAGLTTLVAPLQWWLPAATLVIASVGVGAALTFAYGVPETRRAPAVVG